MSWDASLKPLLTYAGRLHDLGSLAAIADWDQQVNLPADAAEGRALQQETLDLVAHEMQTSPNYAELLQSALEQKFPADSDEAALLRILKRRFDKANAVPAELSGRLVRQQAATMAAWEKAREAEDFALVEKELQALISLKRDYAACFPDAENAYDALLDDFEEGMTCRELDPILAEMSMELPPLVNEIIAKQKRDDAFLSLPYDESKQIEACRVIMEKMGYDFRRGRLDRSTHPFTTTFDLDDVRITTRTRLNEPANCLFSCIHECGHAIYEQNINRKYRRTPLCDGASLAFHESQSRFWENIAGRSLTFWKQLYPQFSAFFQENLQDISVERFTSAINTVAKSFIRTEADEATYNLHILLRVELERALLNGDLTCSELPQAWDDKMQQYFGIRPRNLCEGVLQDVHWYCGSIAYFPTYMLGNLIGGMLLEKLFPAGFPDDIHDIFAILNDQIYQYGAKYTPHELLKRITGKDAIECAPFLRYLRGKHLA